MKTQIVTLSKIAGWLSLALGTIHTCASPLIMKQINILGMQSGTTFLFMFVATGIACLMAGAVMLVATSKEVRNLRTANHIFLISATFMLLLGIGAPIAMSDNPFGYISLVTGVFAMAVTMLRYRN
jgi:hypothetical protein